MRIFKNSRILIISPEGWTHNFVSKHHYALALARMNNKVYFLNPPSGQSSCRESEEQKNLFIVDYKAIRGLNRIPWFLSRYLWRKEVNKIEKLVGGKIDIVWTFDPYRFQEVTQFNGKVSIYYAADEHRNKGLQKILIRNVPFIFSPSSFILNTIGSPENGMTISHGVSEHFFTSTGVFPLPGNNTLKAGYAGNLTMPFVNKSLVLTLVQKFPQVDFIFAGENKDLHKDDTWPEILREKNVFCIGRIPNADVPAFLKACDLLFLIYKPASNSHKILEYLSSGKVIVSTPIEEYQIRKLPDDLLYMAHDEPAYLPLFETVILEFSRYSLPELSKRRIEFARQRTYPSVIAEIDNIIADSMNVK